MSRIQQYRQRKADLLAEADTLAAKDLSGTASAEEMDRIDAIVGKDLPTVEAAISREQGLMDQRRAMDPESNINADTPDEEAARRVANDKAKRFSSLGEQMKAIVLAANPGQVRDPRLKIVNGTDVNAGPTGMNETIGADGGFLVQTDFQSELLQNIYKGGEVISRVRKIPISASSNGLKFNGVDETSRVNGSRWGGIQAYWTPEAGLKLGTRPQFRQVEMTLKKLTGLCYATDELLQDTTALESWISQAFADEFTFKIEDAIIAGTGAGQPLGILNSGAVIQVSKETGQLAGQLLTKNIINMWSRLPARSRANAVWLINVDVEPALAEMITLVKNVAGTENVGGIASQIVAYTPPGTNGNGYATLMGRPVIPVEYAASLNTVGDIILCDLSQYLTIDKGGMQSASSIHARFIYDESVFRFVYRFDGQPLWRVAMTPYHGTLTQSPFVVLQTRP